MSQVDSNLCDHCMKTKQTTLRDPTMLNRNQSIFHSVGNIRLFTSKKFKIFNHEYKIRHFYPAVSSQLFGGCVL